MTEQEAEALKSLATAVVPLLVVLFMVVLLGALP